MQSLGCPGTLSLWFHTVIGFFRHIKPVVICSHWLSRHIKALLHPSPSAYSIPFNSNHSGLPEWHMEADCLVVLGVCVHVCVCGVRGVVGVCWLVWWVCVCVAFGPQPLCAHQPQS